MSAYKRYFFLLIFSAISSVTLGQAASSPFSTFGIGEPFGNALIQNQGMGGVGVSQPQFWSLNNQNPALLVFNYYTVFQAGALLESRTITGDSTSQKNVNGNLGYLVTAFPVKPGRWTTSVGLMPLTKVNYKLQYEDHINNAPPDVEDTVLVTEQGSGGLSQFYWANGIRIHENWSIGIKATYIFGSIIEDNSNLVPPQEGQTLFVVGTKEQTYVKDFQFSGGLSFSKDSLLGGDYRISAGGVYNLSTKLNADKTSIIERRYSTGGPMTPPDTIVRKGGSIFIPASFTFGFSIAKGTKWSAGAEFFSQNWSKFSSINEDDEGLEKAWKASIGGEFTPDQLAIKNYLKRITYRAGFSYEKTPISINNKQLNDIGINFGLSLPTGRSSLDLAFRTGKRGNKSENILEETYFKIYFGVTFNDQWFIKRKFD